MVLMYPGVDRSCLWFTIIGYPAGGPPDLPLVSNTFVSVLKILERPGQSDVILYARPQLRFSERYQLSLWLTGDPLGGLDDVTT